jgi:hypothetical protein
MPGKTKRLVFNTGNQIRANAIKDIFSPIRQFVLPKIKKGGGAVGSREGWPSTTNQSMLLP